MECCLQPCRLGVTLYEPAPYDSSTSAGTDSITRTMTFFTPATRGAVLCPAVVGCSRSTAQATSSGVAGVCIEKYFGVPSEPIIERPSATTGFETLALGQCCVCRYQCENKR